MHDHPQQTRPAVVRVDGNAAAGPLSQVFGFEVTMAVAECGHCRAQAPIAESQAELDRDSVILLCRSCDHTLLTYVWSEDRSFVSFAGLTRVLLPPAS